jgi:hypothetical protein
MDWLELPERSIEIGLTPVARGEYARFEQEAKREQSLRSGTARGPVTGVSVADASVYAEWLSQHEGHRYHLPTLDDMRALAARLRPASGITDRSEDLQRGMVSEDRDPLSEWLACVPEHSNGQNRLRCVTSLSWFRSRDNAGARAALADSRYSFVTFRMVRNRE